MYIHVRSDTPAADLPAEGAMLSALLLGLLILYKFIYKYSF